MLPLSIAQLAELAASVLDEVGLDRVDVLGFSHGGAVAQQFAFQYPSRVRRLVLVATSCGAGATLSSCNTLDGLGIASKFNRSQATSAIWRTLAISAWTSIPFLGAIVATTLVVCGIQDRVAPIANSRSLAGRIPDASLIVLPETTICSGLSRPRPWRASSTRSSAPPPSSQLTRRSLLFDQSTPRVLALNVDGDNHGRTAL